ncbi:hypothetical protein K461DRAFT_16043 [Myriangium duriaei CBS 260.36]|uniref:Uncharacterized protein n=1 Tax=Myriangium duriaei CBS 260.36 TaxID=1168546 RepID=A0A9P4MLH6_9PEZI|nr:hypothetical protein K461DRAFT_16043 [Myriangium duriaei CBS 260.36]
MVILSIPIVGDRLCSALVLPKSRRRQTRMLCQGGKVATWGTATRKTCFAMTDTIDPDSQHCNSSDDTTNKEMYCLDLMEFAFHCKSLHERVRPSQPADVAQQAVPSDVLASACNFGGPLWVIPDPVVDPILVAFRLMCDLVLRIKWTAAALSVCDNFSAMKVSPPVRMIAGPQAAHGNATGPACKTGA